MANSCAADSPRFFCTLRELSRSTRTMRRTPSSTRLVSGSVVSGGIDEVRTPIRYTSVELLHRGFGLPVLIDLRVTVHFALVIHQHDARDAERLRFLERL